MVLIVNLKLKRPNDGWPLWWVVRLLCLSSCRYRHVWDGRVQAQLAEGILEPTSQVPGAGDHRDSGWQMAYWKSQSLTCEFNITIIYEVYIIVPHQHCFLCDFTVINWLASHHLSLHYLFFTGHPMHRDPSASACLYLQNTTLYNRTYNTWQTVSQNFWFFNRFCVWWIWFGRSANFHCQMWILTTWSNGSFYLCVIMIDIFSFSILK